MKKCFNVNGLCYPDENYMVNLHSRMKKIPEKDSLKLVKTESEQKGAMGTRAFKNKKYTDRIKSYTGEILLAAINYDKEKDTHECIIEKYTKEKRYC